MTAPPAVSKPALLLACLALLSLTGCKSDNATAPDARVDLPAVADQRVSEDALESRDLGRPDSDPSPRISLRFIVPGHLTTGHPISVKPKFRLTSVYNYHQGDELVVASKQLRVLSLPARSPVAGDWIPENGAKDAAEFTPAKSFTDDAEYLIEAIPSALVHVDREKTVFRVGSLPRIIQISFASLDKNQVYDALSIRLSEGVPTSAFFAAVKVSVDGKPLSLALRTTSTLTDTLALKLPGGFEIQKLHTIEVAPDVGASKKLDSTYQGKESTTPFSLAIKPVDHLNDSAWTPPLSY